VNANEGDNSASTYGAAMYLTIAAVSIFIAVALVCLGVYFFKQRRNSSGSHRYVTGVEEYKGKADLPMLEVRRGTECHQESEMDKISSVGGGTHEA